MTFSFQNPLLNLETTSTGNETKDTLTKSESSSNQVDPIKTFQPLEPFQPFKSFEMPKPFDCPKSFELVKQVEDNFTKPESHMIQENTSTIQSEIKISNQPSTDGKLSTYTETTIQNEKVSAETTSDGGGLPEGYEPVKPLSPIKPYELEPGFSSTTKESYSYSSTSRKETSSSTAEIKEENIKNTLKEIILDLDNYAEKDGELKDEKEEFKLSYSDAGVSLLRQIHDEQVRI